MVQQIIVSCSELVTDKVFKKTKEPGLMKKHINSMVFCFYLACSLYAEIDFDTCVGHAYDMQSMLVVEKKIEVVVLDPTPPAKNKSIQTKVIKKYFLICIICSECI